MLGPAVHRWKYRLSYKRRTSSRENEISAAALNQSFTVMRVCGPNDANDSNIIALRFGDHETKETVLGVASPRPLGFVCHAFISGEMTA